MKNVKRRQRLRGTCKWGGVTLCVLLFALWLASGWCDATVERYDKSSTSARRQDAWVSQGLLHSSIITSDEVGPGTRYEWRMYCNRRFAGSLWGPPAPPSWSWGFGKVVSPDRNYVFMWIPLWLPFLLIALPTGFLFWSDHRKRTRVGHCTTCGYDLKGNTSGTCPECGATTARAASS